MQVEAIKPGTYVLAVSGGVDSMVLLDVLRQNPQLQLVVAHYEHGIRPDADQDRQLVEAVAASHDIPFVCAHGRLGTGASEAVARDARYAFLEEVRATHDAQAIITAHHQDDLLETGIINMLRGTGRKGLSSLRSTEHLLRPLLQATKQDIYAYATAHGLAWREDSTNMQDKYLRNHVRHRLLPRLDAGAKRLLLTYMERAAAVNPLIDVLLQQDIAAHSSEGGLQRGWFIMLPHSVSCEVMAAWLRQQGIRTFDRKTIDRLVVLAKTGRPGKQGDIGAGYSLEVTKTILQVRPRYVS
ncbi:MAG TPA: tRNA lysidine(34) synthetase TilS [Candidatus Saccharimonadales bacterium]|nr:tRNA lysidine(34) synthetase TilS [Candidatus Saccharimonadales bacterium]